MLGQKSPEFACGQVMYNIKMSELNYVVKETPFSMYVTIRKKFLKGSVKNDIQADITNATIEKEETNEERRKILEKENVALQVKLNDKLQVIAMLTLETEEFEIKNEQLEKEKNKLEDEMEELFKEISNFKQNG